MTPTKGDRAATLALSIVTLMLLLFAGMCTLVPSFASFAGERYALLLHGNIVLRILLTLIVLALMVTVCVRLWVKLFMKPERSLETLALRSGDGGEVRVSLTALESMARRALGEIDGVREMNVMIDGNEDALNVQIDRKVTTGAHIPDVTRSMQQTVRDALGSFPGAAIGEVSVMVSDIVPETDAAQTGKPGKN